MFIISQVLIPTTERHSHGYHHRYPKPPENIIHSTPQIEGSPRSTINEYCPGIIPELYRLNKSSYQPAAIAATDVEQRQDPSLHSVKLPFQRAALLEGKRLTRLLPFAYLLRLTHCQMRTCRPDTAAALMVKIKSFRYKKYRPSAPISRPNTPTTQHGGVGEASRTGIFGRIPRVRWNYRYSLIKGEMFFRSTSS